MPQKQKAVDLILLDGKIQQAVAYGNNAAWICPCKLKTLLLGRSCSDKKSYPKNYRVDCPCKRQYFVIGIGEKLSRVREVREVSQD